ncbi:peroxide stress protein YaaA [Liquorilactobacillus ghanensis]|uniref:peroxide stress protein YaaA n=1 Tax=Liquorilactobacillus ghanensis TaxID=399370 RepID=UPI0039E906F3
MKIVISPAKKMVTDDEFDCSSQPPFLAESQRLLDWLQSLSYQEIKSVWRCSDKLAQLNYRNLMSLELNQPPLTPAIMSYNGIQFQAMGPQLFTAAALERSRHDLYILSGFYGILRALDGIKPYRLEMQAKIKLDEYRNLYDFWGDKLYRELFRSHDTVINLASKEYAKAIEKYLQPTDKWVTCLFKEYRDGKLRQFATAAKRARGNMVRFIVENKINQVADLKKFSVEGYYFSAELSTLTELVFVKNKL